MDRIALIERTNTYSYKANLWEPFIKALVDYKLLKDFDSINVIIDGTNSSFLLAKLFLDLKKEEKYKFSINFLAYDLEEIKNNLEILNIEASVIDFDYKFDSKKIYALHDNYDDVIEETLNNILLEGRYETINPKKDNIIRPLYLIRYKDIKAWERKIGLSFIKKHIPKNQIKIKEIIRELYEYSDSIENNIFKIAENVNAGIIKNKD